MSRISKVSTDSEVKIVTQAIVDATVEANKKSMPNGVSFVSPYDKSRFVTSKNKTIVFLNRVYTTTDANEIKELRAAIESSNGVIQEYKKEEPEKQE